jgi:hypothetical protein
MLRFYLGTTKPNKKNKRNSKTKKKCVRIAKPMPRTRGCDKQLGSNSFQNGFDLVLMLRFYLGITKPNKKQTQFKNKNKTRSYSKAHAENARLRQTAWI